MGAIRYLILTRFKNALKQLIKKPGLLILYILVLGMLVFSLFTALVLSQPGESGSVSEYFILVTVGIAALVCGLSLNQARKTGSTLFSMADVNMLFPSPVKSSSTLIYGALGQMTTLLLVLVFLLFQVINVRTMLGLEPFGILMLYLGVYAMAICAQALSMLIYALLSQHTRYRPMYSRLFFLALFGLAASAILLYMQSSDIAVVGDELYSVLKYVPVFGWFLVLCKHGATGDAQLAYAMLGALAAFAVAAFALLVRLSPDYYEDVLVATENKQVAVEVKKSGRVRSSRVVFRNLRNFPFFGNGAWALFGMHVRVNVREGFLNSSSLSMLFIVVVAKLLFGGSLTGFEMGADPKPALAFLAYLMLFLTMSGYWAQELKKPYIFMIPESPFKKLIAASSLGVLKGLVDGLLCGALMIWLFKAPVYLLPLIALCVAGFAAVYTAGDVLARYLLGETHQKVLGNVVYFGVLILLVIPAAVSLFIFGGALGYVICSALSFGFALLVMLICRGLLTRIMFQ